MTSQTPDLAAVVARLGKVERELRRWRFGTLGVLVLLVGLGASPQGITLEGERLVIHDAKGTVRAVLGTETEKRGWTRLPKIPGIYQDPDPVTNFGLYMYSPDGVEVARLNLSERDTPQLLLTDRQQRAHAWIFAGSGTSMAGLSVSKKSRADLATELEALRKRGEQEKWSKTDKRWRDALSSTLGDESLRVFVNEAGYGLHADSQAGNAHAYLSPSHFGLRSEGTSGAAESHISPWGLSVESGHDLAEMFAGSLFFKKDGKVVWQAP